MENILVFALITLVAVGIIFAIIASANNGTTIQVATPPLSNLPSSTYWDYAQTLHDALKSTTQYTKVLPPSGAWQVFIAPWCTQRGYHYKAHLSGEFTRYDMRMTETILQQDLQYWTAFYGLPPVDVKLSLSSAAMLIITLSPTGQAQSMVRPKVEI